MSWSPLPPAIVSVVVLIGVGAACVCVSDISFPLPLHFPMPRLLWYMILLVLHHFLTGFLLPCRCQPNLMNEKYVRLLCFGCLYCNERELTSELVVVTVSVRWQSRGKKQMAVQWSKVKVPCRYTGVSNHFWWTTETRIGIWFGWISLELPAAVLLLLTVSNSSKWYCFIAHFLVLCRRLFFCQQPANHSPVSVNVIINKSKTSILLFRLLFTSLLLLLLLPDTS